MTAGVVIAIAALAPAYCIAQKQPVQQKVWVMQPLRCADLAIPDTTFIRICLDSSSFRGRALPLLRAALDQGHDTAAAGRLALLAAGTMYKRAENTKALDEFREAVVLGQFADSIAPSPNARFFTAVAAYRAAALLATLNDCASLRDAVRYLEIASNFPFRADVGLEPDTMRTMRELQSGLARARDRATSACASQGEKRPAGGHAPPKR